MNILFIGSVIPSELCIKHKGVSVAGNKMQVGLLQSLSKIRDCNVEILSTYPIATYPTEKVLGMRKKTFQLSNDEKITSIPFINIFLLKQISQMIGLSLGIVRWKKANESNENIIISFNAYPEWSIPVIIFSRIFNIKKICLLADLPFHVINYDRIRQLASNLQIKATHHAIRKFDGLIVLNEQAQIKYAPKLPFCIVDGGIVVNEYRAPKMFRGLINDNLLNESLIVIFAGSLIEYNGVVTLIEAIKSVRNKNIIFRFYGDGPLKKYIIDESQNENRIQYMGLVSNDEILEIQKKASFLINPRPINERISQVTFPSKMLEYMMSGTPVITTKLNGLIKDYSDYLFFINDNSQEMAKELDEIFLIKKELLFERAKRAYKFVSENKNWDVQSKIIYDFSNEILKTDFISNKA